MELVQTLWKVFYGSALRAASANRRYNAVQLLLKNGANKDVMNDGNGWNNVENNHKGSDGGALL